MKPQRSQMMLSVAPIPPLCGVSVDDEKVLAWEQVEEARENDTTTCERLDSVVGNDEDAGRVLLGPAHWSQRKIVVGGGGRADVAERVDRAGVRE